MAQRPLLIMFTAPRPAVSNTLSRIAHPQSAMMVAREEAVEAARRANVDLADGDLSAAKVCGALRMAEELEPSQGQPIIAELATRLWLRPLAWKGPYYPEFEAFLWARLVDRSDLEEHIRSVMIGEGLEASVWQLYCEFLQGMFAASGKTRSKFYSDMLAEVGIRLGLMDVEYGDKAEAFYEKVMSSVHRDHLLVFYSVGLLLKTIMAGYPKDAPLPKRKVLEALYSYFEKNLPIRGKFLNYSKNDSFFKAGVKSGTLSEL